MICEQVEDLGDVLLGIPEGILERSPVIDKCGGAMVALADSETDEDRCMIVVFDLVEGYVSVLH